MKAPRWLTESFRDGVDERAAAMEIFKPAYPAAFRACWLADHDSRRRPCAGPLERFHFIGRQRVKNALGALLPWGAAGTEEWNHFADLIQLAEWDDRNGGIGCEAHHRRFDSQMTPRLVVARADVPRLVHEFAGDWGIDEQLRIRFPELLKSNGSGRLPARRSTWKV